MMVKRLRLADKLLNPQNAVLIVTIDKKKYLHMLYPIFVSKDGSPSRIPNPAIGI